MDVSNLDDNRFGNNICIYLHSTDWIYIKLNNPESDNDIIESLLLTKLNPTLALYKIWEFKFSFGCMAIRETLKLTFGLLYDHICFDFNLI